MNTRWWEKGTNKEASTCGERGGAGVPINTVFGSVLGSKTTTEIKSPKTSGTMCISERKINTCKEAVFFQLVTTPFSAAKGKNNP